jgi:type IV pilus assembly protein PilF
MIVNGMSGGRLAKLLLPALALLLLAACTGGVRDGGATAETPGGSGKESPGDLYVKLAVEYLRAGQLETASVKAQQALKTDPSNAQGHNVMALVYQRLGQHQLAEKHFREAVGLQPTDPFILNSYASYLCTQRKFVEAETQYNKALANPLYPTPWVAMTNMGLCAKSGGNSGKAEVYFGKALNVNPLFAPALAAMADLEYSRGSFKSARSYLDRYFKTSQPTPQVLLLAVRVERKLGAPKRASTYAQMLRQSYPGSAEARQL